MPDLGWATLATWGIIAILLIVVTCVVVLVLIVKLVGRFKDVNQPGMPISAKLAYYGSIIYTVVPFDLLPDPVLVDDIGFLVGALIHVGRSARKIHAAATGRSSSGS